MEYKERYFTTIAISKKNYKVLKKHGNFGETFNDILSRILDVYDNLEKEVKR